LHRSPGNSSPRLRAGDESGFFLLYNMTELELLQSAFSAQRMSKYLRYHHDDSNAAIQHYKANIRLAESFYTSLSVFEVVLRNALSKELELMTGRSDWYTDFASNPAFQNLNTEITQAIRHIQERGETIYPDKVVSELTFGFWVMLLNRQYEMTLWKSLRKAFPYMPKNIRQRKNVSTPCNVLRKLRNRIFHHEAICWDLDYIEQIHTDLITILGWINKDMPSWLTKIDHFDFTLLSIRKELK